MLQISEELKKKLEWILPAGSGKIEPDEWGEEWANQFEGEAEMVDNYWAGAFADAQLVVAEFADGTVIVGEGECMRGYQEHYRGTDKEAAVKIWEKVVKQLYVGEDRGQFVDYEQLVKDAGWNSTGCEHEGTFTERLNQGKWFQTCNDCQMIHDLLPDELKVDVSTAEGLAKMIASTAPIWMKIMNGDPEVGYAADGPVDSKDLLDRFMVYSNEARRFLNK